MSGQDTTSNSERERLLAERLRQAIGTAFSGDGDLCRRGRDVDARCLVEIGAQRLLVTLRDGRAAAADQVALLGSWDFAIRAEAEVWEALWQPVPQPGWHDLFALTKRGAMRIEGSLHPFISHLQFFKDLVTLPREGGAR